MTRKNAVRSSFEYASSFRFAFEMPAAPLEKHNSVSGCGWLKLWVTEAAYGSVRNLVRKVPSR
jgi:hypothetical protein